MWNYEIKPREELEILLKKWHLLVLAGILGGLMGYACSAILTPRYEARATMQVNLTLPKGQVLTDSQTDYTLHSAIDLVSSTPWIRELVGGFRQYGKNIEVSDLSLERRENYWDLVVRNPDPQLAAEAANLWLDETLARLEQAGLHSLRASEVATQLSVLEGCMLDQSHPLCGSFSDMESLSRVTQDLWQQYQSELELSHGLSPMLTWHVESRASVPANPVIWRRSTLVLAGVGLGLVLGLPALRLKYRKHR